MRNSIRVVSVPVCRANAIDKENPICVAVDNEIEHRIEKATRSDDWIAFFMMISDKSIITWKRKPRHFSIIWYARSYAPAKTCMSVAD